MNSKSYEEFRHDAFHELMERNDACEKNFHIESCPRWDYDLDAGTLIFSDDGVPKVVATIQVVGTTASDDTWLWGWGNSNLPEHVTNEIKRVRDFGHIEGINQLTQSMLPNDDDLGWQLTSVAARVIGAKGAYRCPDAEDEKTTYLYVVYTDIRFATDADLNRPKRLDCDHHERGFGTYICEHLADNPVQEWFSEEPSEENRWPDAWCGKCDRIFLQAGGWNEENSKSRDIRVLCHHCYEEKRAQGTL